MAEMQIQIGADINGAIRGLQQVETQTQQTFSKVAATSKQAGTAVFNLSRVVQDAPFGFIAISNNLQPLFDNFAQLKTQSGSIGGALKSLGGALVGPAGISLAFAAATSLVTVFSKELFSSGEAAKKAKSESDKLKESISGVFSETAKEAANVSSLVAVLRAENETRDRKLQAIKDLKQIQPEVFANLKLEGNEVVGLTNAYNNYIESLKTAVAAKIKQAQLEQTIEKLLKVQGVTLTDQEKTYKDLADQILNVRLQQTEGSVAGTQLANKQKKETQAQASEVKKLQSEIQRLSKELTELSKGIDIKPLKVDKVKVDKKVKDKISYDLDKLLQDLQFRNPVLEALQPKKLSDYQKIGEAISQNIQKGIKPIVSNIAPQIQENLDNQKKALQEQLTVAQGVAGGISNAFAQAFGSIAEGENVFNALGNALKGFVLELVQATIKALIFRAIVNAFVPGGASAVGATGIANLLGFRANGGPVTGRSPYIVGERGPELFVPSVSGNVVPNNQLSSFNGRSAFATAMGGRSIVRGNDILLTYARTQRSQSRVNG